MPDTTLVDGHDVLPCPFCGSMRLYFSINQPRTVRYVYVFCDDCGGEGPAGSGPDVALRLWNRRYDPEDE